MKTPVGIEKQEHKIIWEPIPGTSQELALDSPCNVTLYTGSRGPGKTDAQIMLFRRYVGIGYGQHWRGVIFDREYKNLDDVVSKSKRWFNQFEDGAKFNSSKADYKWTWPTGEELYFRALKKLDDYWDYHGQEFPFIGWNELTKFATPDVFDMMFSCNRTSFKPGDSGLPEIPLRVFATCNPYGVGHNWVKRRFIDVGGYGKIIKKTVDVFNPRTQQIEPVTRTQTALFGSYKENIYLSPEYIAGMMEIADENIKKAWLDGNWDIVVGGAFDDLWNRKKHVIPRVPIPEGWHIDRSFDWGSTAPFSVGWWAQANGEELWPGFAPIRGSLIQIAEWYGTKALGSGKGMMLGPTDLAHGIVKIETGLMQDGWISTQPWPGPADNQIGNKITVEDETIERKMQDVGVTWTKSDKSAGSRKNGLMLFRDRLQHADCKPRPKLSFTAPPESPGIYFMENCLASIALLPTLPRDPDDMDDVDTMAEDHIWDMVRYRVLKGSERYASNLKVRI